MTAFYLFYLLADVKEEIAPGSGCVYNKYIYLCLDRILICVNTECLTKNKSTDLIIREKSRTCRM